MSNNYDLEAIIGMLRDIGQTLSTTLDAGERRIYTAVLAGVALAGHAQMPTTPTSVPANYFLMNHQTSIGEKLACIAERVPLDVALALDCARNAFIFRYRLVFESSLMTHVLLHLAECTDDVMPGKIREVLTKVKGCTDEDNYRSNLTHSLATVASRLTVN